MSKYAESSVWHTMPHRFLLILICYGLYQQNKTVSTVSCVILLLFAYIGYFVLKNYTALWRWQFETIEYNSTLETIYYFIAYQGSYILNAAFILFCLISAFGAFLMILFPPALKKEIEENV